MNNRYRQGHRRQLILTLGLALGLAPAACGSDDDKPPATDGGAIDVSTDGAGDVLVDAPATDTAPDRTGDMMGLADLAFTPDVLSRLKLPAGFQINVFARDLGQPRWMTVTPDGSVFVTRQEDDVMRLRDANGDGVAEIQVRAAQGIANLSGLTNNGTQLFFIGSHVYHSPLSAEGVLMMPEPMVFTNLRQGGITTDRALGIGKEGRLYIAMPGESAPTGEPKPSIISGMADSGGQAVFAFGLRKPLGLAWHPTSGEMWAIDQGSDSEGAAQAPDELNKITAGANYGWPICTGKNSTVSPTGPAPTTGTKEAFCAQAVGSSLDLPAGSGASSLVFYDGSHFPMEYKGDAFVALSGGTASPATAGFKVVRVRFTGNQPTAVEDFLTGFLAADGTASYGRPQGLAVAPDGSLLVTDEGNGVIYRISRGTGTDAGAGGG